MMAHDSKKYNRLVGLLKELFQLDQPDLDFGLYRIMHAKSAEVTQFLDRDLLPQVAQAFSLYKTADKAELEKELATAIAQAQSLGVDPESSPKVKELRHKLANEAVDVSGLESEVYDHLYSFFRRYYSEGDFLAKRVYRPGVYAIPYEGEEVTLYWANRDQYYIKTSEYLRDYAFRLRPDDAQDPMRVHFRLVDAVEGEHGVIKTAAERERVFILADSGETGHDFISEVNGAQGKELSIGFEYRPATLTDWPQDLRTGKAKPPSQKELILVAAKQLLGVRDSALAVWLAELGRPHPTSSGEQADYTRLEAHLRRYAARNTFDYFIHKDLSGFLRRELDFFIKNEIMYLDDVESDTAPRVEQYLSKIKIIRIIAGKVIDFLAQLENFQRKLWLKKKFVVETRYCITVGRIPEEFYPEIIANDCQREEWIDLYSINDIIANLTTIGYTSPLSIDFLKEHPTMVVDTRYFSTEFTTRLLESVEDFESQVDGILVHSENFQGLKLLQRRLANQVECIYIDPPYNTGDSEILYKNEYLRSSWLALIENRLEASYPLLSVDPIYFIAIDDFEMVDLAKLVDTQLSAFQRNMIVVNHHPQGGQAKTLAQTHEYMLACVRKDSEKELVGRATDDGVEERPFRRSGTAQSNYRMWRQNSFYALLVDPTNNRVVGLESPPIGSDYPLGSTESGLKRVYPIGANGEERVWRKSFESCKTLVAGAKLKCSDNMTIYQLIEGHERTTALFSNWTDSRFNAGTHGANLLRDILGTKNAFAYPKSIHTVQDAIFSASLDENAWVLDYFGGSGTTAHAVVNLNREEGSARKFILIETGDHFNEVIVPRMKKIVYSPSWKDGKPVGIATKEDFDRSPRVMKVVRLESYEDALNNLETRRTSIQQSLLDAPDAQGAGGFREQFLLRYMLNVDSRGSQSLLNVQAFQDPTSYKLTVKRPGSDESREVSVDLLETFNWLIGLTVKHIAAPHNFRAEFERDTEKRLRIKGRVKQETAGPWWFRTVMGTTPDGRRTLIIWRKLTGNPEQDNLVLDEWFTKQGYSTRDFEFQVIYVNGDNNLENLKAPDDTWKVRLIEEDFHRLMFDTEGV
jgi:adenine-specific DNA-methyltransferase